MKFVICSLLLLCFYGCDRVLLGPEEDNTVINNFEIFWQDYRDHYGNFRVKNIDWDAVYATYRPQLNEQSTEADLYRVLGEMVRLLNDAHVFLDPTDPLPSVNSGVAGQLAEAQFYNFDLDLVVTDYLTEVIGTFPNLGILYGRLPNNLGYIFMQEMNEDLASQRAAFNQIMNELATTDGLVLDLRNNNGGEDEAGRLIAGFFTESPNLYMLSRYKIGPGPDDFEEFREWRIDPAETTYSQAVMWLTNRYSVSGAETFGLALKTLPQFTQVGDTTAAAFSDTYDRELPNRWFYGMPVAEVFDGLGVSYEGIGLIPDELVIAGPEDIDAGQDLVLERALELF
ncbi:MAG: S41 family peptidase [Bacteroidota bacterium]